MEPHQIRHPEVQLISQLVPFGGLIISITCIFYFLVRFYILEDFLLHHCYGTTYTLLNDTNRRGFVNHHIAGATKLLILLAAAYPFLDVMIYKLDFNRAYAGSSVVTHGDVLVVVAHMLIAMYVFELCYRVRISPVSVGHHIGTILIGQAAMAISLDPAHKNDAGIEFGLCLLLGAFDIIAEFFPHVCIILYRIYPLDHIFLRALFRVAALSTFIGSVCELSLAIVVFLWLWNQWTLIFKITTPILLTMFTSAQLWGSWNLWKMMRVQEERIPRNSRGDTESGEGTGPVVDSSTVQQV